MKKLTTGKLEGRKAISKICNEQGEKRKASKGQI